MLRRRKAVVARYSKAAEASSLDDRFKTMHEAERIAAEPLSLPLGEPNADAVWDAKALR